MDQADMPEIIRHFIDEIGAAYNPVGQGVGDILFTKPADGCFIKLWQHTRVTRIVEIEFAPL